MVITIHSIIDNFNEKDARRVKAIERKTNHDVKAVEYFLREKIKQDALHSFIHFACTSEDINNLAYGLILIFIGSGISTGLKFMGLRGQKKFLKGLEVQAE